MPMFNCEKYIQTCIDSILQQTFKDFELIVIDNCSTDRSCKIIEKYSDPRIKLRRNKRKLSESENRNREFTLTSESIYIFQIDSRDAILPQTLEKFFDAAEKSQSDVVYSNSKFIVQDPNFKLNDKLKVSKQVTQNLQPRFLSENLIDRLQCEFIEHGIFNDEFGKLLRRDFLLESSICLPETISNLAVLIKARRAQVIDFCGYLYRQRIESNPQNVLKESLKNLPEIVAEIEDHLQNLSLENQLILKSQVIFECLITRLMRFNLAMEKKDQILKEFFNSLNEMNPEIFRAVFESFMIFATQCSNSNRKSIFQLK